ncbi:MAG: LemA protein [Parcubacteria group bacterium LiPW_39]|nr:MAG: LemA protein [Parcubacteria group bacterium LiPW_39]
MKKTLLIILAIIVLVGAYAWSFYNGLVKQDQAIASQWAQVENQFQRRFDLIPNLVNSVQGAMSQEQKVFGDLADARTKYAGAQTTEQKVAAANEVEGALARLLAIMENYPQLKSIEAVQQLMAQLEGTENRIAVERGRFNDVVRVYNTRVTQVPGRWLAPMFGFSAKAYFEAAAGAETAPEVKLNQ